MSWLDKIRPPKIRKDEVEEKVSIPEGLWVKCPDCSATLYATDLEKNLKVCPKCHYHFPLNARERLQLLLDEDADSVEIGAAVRPVDTLKFRDSRRYTERLQAAKKLTSEEEALVAMHGKMQGMDVVIAAFEFNFIGGSMGAVVGERFYRAIQQACTLKCPFICVAASGGARMQEGLQSLMQMAKTSAALHLLSDAKLPFISVLTHPTMGGVSASFAFLGDVVIAEPNALIGFAGPRVIEQTVRETLPEGFQRAEFILKKGALDQIVDRRDLKKRLSLILRMLMNQPVPDTTGNAKAA